MTKLFSMTLVTLALVIGCRKDPIERLRDPLPDGALSKSSGQFILYDDELRTGGGVGLIPTGDNQVIDLNNQDEPRDSFAQIKYVWNGQDVSGQHAFAGFSLLITPNSATLSAAPAKDFSGPGYTTLKFKLRGSLSADNSLRCEGPSNGSSSAARMEISGASISNSEWREVSVSVPSSDFAAVKVFATFSIQYPGPPRTTNAGNGGTVYIDNVRYEK